MKLDIFDVGVCRGEFNAESRHSSEITHYRSERVTPCPQSVIFGFVILANALEQKVAQKTTITPLMPNACLDTFDRPDRHH